MTRNILVIKLGALGDFAQAFAPMKAIRDHHPGDQITLLTRSAYAGLGTASGFFDQVWIDEEPKFWQLGKVLALRDRLRSGGFSRVYDLQTSDRSSSYFKLFWPGEKPEWSGIVPAGSHYHHYQRPTMQHNFDRQSDQLRIAGIEHMDLPVLSHIKADLGKYDLPERYSVIIPASSNSPKMADKLWPAENYGALASHLSKTGLPPVILGGPDAGAAAKTIQSICSDAIDLAGQTDLTELPTITGGAKIVIGGDTGPTHVAAYSGAPTIALFSSATLPAKAAPRGAKVTIIVRSDLKSLTPDEVIAEIDVLATSI